MNSTPSLFEPVAWRSRSRVHEVLMGEHCRWSISERQRALLNVLYGRCGRENAIPIADLSTRLKMQPREIKEAVRELRLNFSVPIGSARTGEGGYYLITSIEELMDTVRPYVGQAYSELAVARALAGDLAVNEMLGQMQLAVDTSAKPQEAQ